MNSILNPRDLTKLTNPQLIEDEDPEAGEQSAANTIRIATDRRFPPFCAGEIISKDLEPVAVYKTLGRNAPNDFGNKHDRRDERNV